MIAIRNFLFMTVLLGVAYPAVVTLLAQSFFQKQANGSLIYKKNQLIGSSLIAQDFKDNRYFWPRPSAVDFNPLASGASNLGPTSADLFSKVAQRKAAGRTLDLLFASGSGLDPDISPESARAQITRIASARRLNQSQREKLSQLVEMSIENRQFGFLGEPRVNVLKMNLKLDEL